MTRREFAAAAIGTATLSAQTAPDRIERWGVFETAFNGPAGGNPFLDVEFRAEFRNGHRIVEAAGFYDGAGVYRVRFMPDTPGEWTYTTRANRPALDGKTGRFICTAAAPGNRGPVAVRETHHFAYADGTPYYPVGTTCYAWTHQGDELERQTLATLRTAPFNKMRMCVFPKHYAWNSNEPQYYPFPRDASGRNDFTRFDPAFFRHLETRVRDLCGLGIEADLILFHPYDRWGYATMPAEVDDRYLRYVVARLAAFRNVWWSMANEYDFMKAKSMADWDRFFHVVQAADPYQRLRGIHNSGPMYDHAKPWVTHVSVQSADLAKAADWRALYRKPVIYDECQYEGNIPRRWGNISAQEMVRRFWLAWAAGAYAGHGETYLHPQEILWWSKGGTLRGESPARIAFLRKLMEATGPLTPLPNQKYPAATAGDGACFLYYFDLHQPAELEFELPADARYTAEVIDPWLMTSARVAGAFSGKFTLPLPGKPYQAVRFRRGQ